MPEPLRLIVVGAAGRMGSRVCALASADRRFRLAGRVLRSTPARRLREIVCDADAIVDFSAPAASLACAQAAAAARKAIVIGTTGWTPSQRLRLKALSRRAPILLSPNFSFGVNILYLLAKTASRLLPDHEAGVAELHHSLKKDAPSGTALALAAALGRGKVPIVSQRLGDAVGEHTLTLAGPSERLELTHRAHSRDVFALGALEAALWLRGKRPGLYAMKDLLGLA
ncbi:MAG: 4-hydroxy-tetrahydrodipicolinate reductase [Elusimicrobia bacterium]|nr:4-hydroxy-tetrahydrodipicolinate reductase [Elusimicrobiota bacterium]